MRLASVPLATAGAVAVASLLGCEAESADSASLSASLVDKQIGDPCEPEDGWRPPALVTEADLETSEMPVATAVPDGHIDRTQLAPGVHYCISGGQYPRGYFTTNCELDRHCRGRSVCLDGQCRMPCRDDSECSAPTTCEQAERDLAFCRCVDCVK